MSLDRGSETCHVGQRMYPEEAFAKGFSQRATGQSVPNEAAEVHPELVRVADAIGVTLSASVPYGVEGPRDSGGFDVTQGALSVVSPTGDVIEAVTQDITT